MVHFALDHGEEPPAERVLKFMRNREQWSREVAVRGGGVADGTPAEAAATAVGAAAADAAADEALAAAAAPKAAAAGAGAAAEAVRTALRLNEEHVLPVLRQHELLAEEMTEKRAFAGAEEYPYVLVMERGDEDLSGACPTRCCHRMNGQNNAKRRASYLVPSSYLVGPVGPVGPVWSDSHMVR